MNRNYTVDPMVNKPSVSIIDSHPCTLMRNFQISHKVNTLRSKGYLNHFFLNSSKA